MFTVLLILFVIVIILLIPAILLQSGSGASAGMFGNDLAMGAFGAKTSEVLVKFTKWLVGAFLILALLLGYMKIQETKAYTRQKQQQTTQEQSAPSAGTNAGEAMPATGTLPAPGTLPVSNF